MKKIIISITLFTSLLQASSMRTNEPFISAKQMQELKVQTNPYQWKKAYTSFSTLKPMYQALEKKYSFMKLYKNPQNITNFLEGLKLIYTQHKNIITGWILLEEYLKTSNIYSKKQYFLYVRNDVNYLYKHQICQGYMFKGFQENFYAHNKSIALKVYKRGIVECKVPWQTMMIQARLSSLLYQN